MEAALILAAGSSSRLGQPKQLLKVNDVPLLSKTLQAARDAGFARIVVVLGSNYQEHKSVIENLPVEIVFHTDWAKGMGSSLKAGLKKILENHPKTEAVVVTVCDQPHLSGSHLKALLNKYHVSHARVVASKYNNTLGVPALFDQSLFEDLLQVADGQGAKVVIQKQTNQVEFVDWPEGNIDIDTPADLKHL